MKRRFSLAGLLRLRRLQEDEAVGELAVANTRVRQSEAVQARARRNIEGHVSAVASGDALRAMAASRASSAAMLSELLGVHHQHVLAQTAAQTAFQDARIASRGVEKLEQRHRVRVQKADLAEEQNALDEIAGLTRDGGL